MKIAIVNSAQSKNPKCNSSWIQSTLAAMDYFAERGASFVASVGLCTWELVLWKAGQLRTEVDVVFPLGPDESASKVSQSIVDDFCLDVARCRFHPVVDAAAHTARRKAWWTARDRTALLLADRIVPISVRRGGRMEGLLGTSDFGAKVDRSLEIPYAVDGGGARWKRGAGTQEPITGMLLHFTRAREGRWPGETANAFYRDLCGAGSGYPRDGFATLARMVGERTIRGCSRGMRGHVPMTCFTELGIWDALSLVRWRRRYARYAFEPYAVGIIKSRAIDFGAKPVDYDDGPSRQSGDNCGAEPFFCQGRGRMGQWAGEREWRIVGDVNLDACKADEVLVLTATTDEAQKLERTSPFPVRSLGYVNR